MTVANTILDQLGGNKFLVMTGAKNLVGTENILQMTLPRVPGNKVNRLRVRLRGDDTYTVETFKFSSRTLEAQGCWQDGRSSMPDNLQAVFTSLTGLHTHL